MYEVMSARQLFTRNFSALWSILSGGHKYSSYNTCIEKVSNQIKFVPGVLKVWSGPGLTLTVDPKTLHYPPTVTLSL